MGRTPLSTRSYMKAQARRGQGESPVKATPKTMVFAALAVTAGFLIASQTFGGDNGTSHQAASLPGLLDSRDATVAADGVTAAVPAKAADPNATLGIDKAKGQALGVGDTHDLDDVSVVFEKVRAKNLHQVEVTLTVRNERNVVEGTDLGNKTVNVDPSLFTIMHKRDVTRHVPVHIHASVAGGAGEYVPYTGTLAPGETVTVWVIFDRAGDPGKVNPAQAQAFIDAYDGDYMIQATDGFLGKSLIWVAKVNTIVG